AIAQTRRLDRLPNERASLSDNDFDNTVASSDGQSLPQIHIGVRHVLSNVVYYLACDIRRGRALDAFQAGRRVDFHHLWTVVAFQHIDPSNAQTEDLRSPDRCCFVHFVELDTLNGAPT